MSWNDGQNKLDHTVWNASEDPDPDLVRPASLNVVQHVPTDECREILAMLGLVPEGRLFT